MTTSKLISTKTKANNRYGVYVITNMITGYEYVGKGYTDKYGFCPRWYAHIRFPRNPTHLQCAIQKHGAENFKAEWIRTRLTEDDAYALEEHEINLRQSLINGYNRALGGRGGKGISLTLETRQKMSVAKMGHVVTLDTRKKLSDANASRTESEIQLISATLRAQKLGALNPAKRPEVRVKMKASALTRQARARVQSVTLSVTINLILPWSPKEKLRGRGTHWAVKRSLMKDGPKSV